VVNREAALIEEIKPLLGQDVARCDCCHACCFLDVAWTRAASKILRMASR
jgi:hypothetical protein